jgi:hypothetical protein
MATIASMALVGGGAGPGRGPGRDARVGCTLAGAPLALLEGLGLCFLLAACGGSGAGPEVLEVVRFRQSGLDRVFLNEVLVVAFDADLDPASVHRGSVRLVDEDGERVEGGFRVERNTLRFEPFLPRTPELLDGSLRPDCGYRLELRGFPMPDGLRALSGAPLAGAWAATFRTSAQDPLFDDPTLGSALPLAIESALVEREGPIRLRCGEPLDPRSSSSARFELRRLADQRGPGIEPIESIPLRAELVANGPDGALLELWPVDSHQPGAIRRLLPLGDAHLWADPGSSQLLDLGANPVPLAWPVAIGPVGDLQVVDSEREPASRSYLFDFLDPSARSPEAPPGADGTAWWSDTGEVGIRLPSVVGGGSDGAVVLGSDESAPARISATTYSVPAGVDARLPDRGLVVHAAQRSLVVDGRLHRRTLPVEQSWRDDESPRDWWQRHQREGRGEQTRPIDFLEGERALDWLARAERTDPDWTVLVAGGDMIIEGELRCDGPLVLIAGGRIRARGPVSASAIWLSEGGGLAAPFPQPQPLPFDHEEPSTNPLVEPLRVQIYSDPFRAPEGEVRWSFARTVVDSGLGRASVKFLGERRDASGRREPVGPVDEPQLLGESPTIRLLLELELGPTPPSLGWRPPRIDSVELFWEPAGRTP